MSAIITDEQPIYRIDLRNSHPFDGLHVDGSIRDMARKLLAKNDFDRYKGQPNVIDHGDVIQIVEVNDERA